MEWLKGFFGSLRGLLVRAPDGKGDYETAMENYYIAASIGAKADLKDFFTGARPLKGIPRDRQLQQVEKLRKVKQSSCLREK